MAKKLCSESCVLLIEVTGSSQNILENAVHIGTRVEVV